MKPSKGDQHAIVDLVDMLLDKGAVVEADVLITVADIPLVGLKLRAALAGMATMREYGMFEEWDEIQRELNREDESRHPLKSHRVSTSEKKPKPNER
ncbi:Gas vesicle protein [Halopelagius inordinatus]|uniref:Gas vesicle protein n=1 Tax=Halopelagius inordinatus TaxID=553467 RepID=A0A1I2T8D9_9EURY|nr:gas vesicle protein [Halopelagius inordinatus]SFG61294.1 Gas vesicle protein [Halopelagius inordinatus]